MTRINFEKDFKPTSTQEILTFEYSNYRDYGKIIELLDRLPVMDLGCETRPNIAISDRVAENTNQTIFKIVMRIQDNESTDYECPFEAKFTNEEIAKAAFNAILDRRVFWNDLICKKYGLTNDKDPWIQLFLIEDGRDYSDDDEYWMSYEVL